MKKNLPKYMTKGGPGDAYLGDGNIDTSSWFENLPETSNLSSEIKNGEIWFCSAPFQMLYCNTLGELMPCSWAAEKYGSNIENTDLTDWFINDPLMNDLRSEMTSKDDFNKQAINKICGNCIKQEKLYGRSRRQASLKIQSNDRSLWPRIEAAVQEFKDTGVGSMQHRVFEVQLKIYGNKCNLDCYMCHPYDSNIRHDTLDSVEHIDQDVFDPKYMILGQYAYDRAKELDLNKITEQIAVVAPYIWNLKLIGGEPLVMKSYYKLLDAIVATGHAKDIKIKYQTNLSALGIDRFKIVDYFDKFRFFEVTVSLDGIGKVNDYIRRRGNFDVIVDNIKQLKKYDNVTVNLNGTISFLSVLRFYELIQWIENHEELFDQVNWSNIRKPEKLCANNLPLDLKQKLIPMYDGWPDIQNVLREESEYDYSDAIDYLLMNDKYYEGTKWEMHLFDVFPELIPYSNRIEMQNL